MASRLEGDAECIFKKGEYVDLDHDTAMVTMGPFSQGGSTSGGYLDSVRLSHDDKMFFAVPMN